MNSLEYTDVLCRGKNTTMPVYNFEDKDIQYTYEYIRSIDNLLWFSGYFPIEYELPSCCFVAGMLQRLATWVQEGTKESATT